MALRPEKISIAKTAPPDTRENCTEGTVEDIAYLGDMSVYNVRLKTGKLVKVTQPNLIRHAAETINWDEHVYLTWNAASGVVLTV